MFHDKLAGLKKPSKHLRAPADGACYKRGAGVPHEYVFAKERFAELTNTLQRHGYRNLRPLEADLLSIAAAVAHVDRLQIRSNTQWERSLRLICSVNVPDVWNEPLCQQALGRCLGALTYDRWDLEFRSAGAPALEPTDGACLKLSNPTVLLPFSDGLDSLATYELIRTQGAEAPIALTLKTSPGIVKSIKERRQRPDPWAFVKVLLRAGNHAETSSRSRSFLFLVVAMVLARLCDVKRILIPETGQGAIGAALTPFGEPSAWGSHPYFTRLFARFVDLIPWEGRSVCVEHPNLWKTKAELLTELAGLADLPGDSRLREQARLISEAQGLSLEQATKYLQHLLARHKAEWERFLAAEVAPGSWVRRLCG